MSALCPRLSGELDLALALIRRPSVTIAPTEERRVNQRPGATRAARRQRELIDELTRDLGHEPDAAEKLLIHQAAGLVGTREAMERAALRGEPISADAMIKLANSAIRTIAALRCRAAKGPASGGTSMLDSILAAKRGAA